MLGLLAFVTLFTLALKACCDRHRERRRSKRKKAPDGEVNSIRDILDTLAQEHHLTT